jgi:probable addiction module antidote protein
MAIETLPFDAAKYLDDEESQTFLLNDAIDTGEPGYIAHALGTIARARGGLLLLERRTGIKRQTLAKSLGPNGNPTLETLIPVLKALGLRMRVETAPANDLELVDA